MVRGYIKQEQDGRCVVYCRRDRFKHLYPIGAHRATDEAFLAALAAGEVKWAGKIYNNGRLF